MSKLGAVPRKNPLTKGSSKSSFPIMVQLAYEGRIYNSKLSSTIPIGVCLSAEVIVFIPRNVCGSYIDISESNIARTITFLTAKSRGRSVIDELTSVRRFHSAAGLFGASNARPEVKSIGDAIDGI